MKEKLNEAEGIKALITASKVVLCQMIHLIGQPERIKEKSEVLEVYLKSYAQNLHSLKEGDINQSDKEKLLVMWGYDKTLNPRTHGDSNIV